MNRYIEKLNKLANKFEQLIKMSDNYEWNKPLHTKITPMEPTELHLKHKPQHIETAPMLPATREEEFEEELALPEETEESLGDDYEPCGVCGYDHEYDFLDHNSSEYKKVLKLHQEAGEIVDDDKDNERWNKYDI